MSGISIPPELSASFEQIRHEPIVRGMYVTVRARWGGALEDDRNVLRYDPITCKCGDAKVISPEELEQRYRRATHRARKE